MFGTYRTFLAVAVAIQHLAGVPLIGQYAVNGFFILSGFLMTLIMQQSYGYTLAGIKAFAINRFLRLFPIYWFVLAISFLLFVLVGQEFTVAFKSIMYVPETLGQWVQNITLVYWNIFPNLQSPRFSPPTWALTIELFYYLLIALGLSRSKALTYMWFLGGVAYMVLTHYLDYPYPYRYEILFAGSLPFSIGAMIYHHKALLLKLPQFMFNKVWLVSLFIVYVANVYVALKIPDGEAITVTYYLNYFIHTCLVIGLWLSSSHLISARKDKIIGDYSYPVYLLHWQCGLLIAYLLDVTESALAFVLSMVLTFVLSWLGLRLIEKPVEAMRQRVKKALPSKERLDALKPTG